MIPQTGTTRDSAELKYPGGSSPILLTEHTNLGGSLCAGLSPTRTRASCPTVVWSHTRPPMPVVRFPILTCSVSGKDDTRLPCEASQKKILSLLFRLKSKPCVNRGCPYIWYVCVLWSSMIAPQLCIDSCEEQPNALVLGPAPSLVQITQKGCFHCNRYSKRLVSYRKRVRRSR